MRGPTAFLPMPELLGLLPPLQLCQAASSSSSPEVEAGGPQPTPRVSPQTLLARPAPRTGAFSHLYFGIGARGEAGRAEGLFLILFPPDIIILILRDTQTPPENASINPPSRGRCAPGVMEAP